MGPLYGKHNPYHKSKLLIPPSKQYILIVHNAGIVGLINITKKKQKDQKDQIL